MAESAESSVKSILPKKSSVTNTTPTAKTAPSSSPISLIAGSDTDTNKLKEEIDNIKSKKVSYLPPSDTGHASTYRYNNLIITAKSILRHLTNIEDVKKHLGSPSKIKNTVRKNLIPRIQSVISPEKVSKTGYEVMEGESFGFGYMELRRPRSEAGDLPIGYLVMMPEGVKFDFYYIDQTKIINPNWTGVIDTIEGSGNKVVAFKTGATYEVKKDKTDRMVRVPSFGTALKGKGGKLVEEIPFMERRRKDEVQHGGIVVTSDNSLGIVDYSTLKKVFEDVRENKADPNLVAAYQADWFAKQSDFEEIRKRPNMMQSNRFNVVGQYMLASGESRYFFASNPVEAPIGVLFDLVEQGKAMLASKVVDVRLAGMEFNGGEALFINRKEDGKEAFFFPNPDEPLSMEFVQTKPDYLIAFMPHGL
ncbi:MAG TPA: hypothetical protein VF185_04225 [Patescibacteria group bacterium]